MTFALVRNGQVTEISRARGFKDIHGRSQPVNVLDRWPADQLAAIGVFPIVDDPVPAGVAVTGYTLVFEDNRVRRSWQTTATGETVEQAKDRIRLHAQTLLDEVSRWSMADAPDLFANWADIAAYRRALTVIALNPPPSTPQWPAVPAPVLKSEIQ